ncbi:gag/pol protein [Cucumis melo var. makuwa]|uniref:Gag/pol protein n=1 Tax=Cucumis melo var. makuwa TaxID=1194695 RepID=A0A5A7TXS5_CUCMM|nr:gag/pol protein [Cucumis melo var. makuwa]
MSDVLAKKYESLATAKEIMDSLKGIFGQPERSLRHEAIKYIYTKRMKEGTSVREHVLDMNMHFNIVEINGGTIDEANQVSFILESLPKSFIPFQTNASLNKIEFNLTLLNELHGFQNFTKGKEKEVEANVVTTNRKFKRGLSSKSKSGPSKPNRKIEKKGKGKTPKQTKGKKTTEKGATNHICFPFQEISSWKRLSEGEITLKVGTGEMVSATAVGDLKLEEDTNISSALLMIILGKKIKILRSDLDGGYMDLRFQDYLIEHGIQSQLSTPSTPQQNGYALETAIYILNNVPSKSVSETPYELWKGHRSSSSTKVVDNTRNIGQTHPSQELREPRHSGRVVQQPDRYLGLSEAQINIPDDGIEDPLTYKQAINDVDYDQWIKAMDLEVESMYSIFVWTLVDQPSEVRPIGCKWIYKRKRDQAGKVQTFKARLVAKGYTQKEMDVKTTFLNGNLEESIYMVQPEGFIQKGKEQKVCKLQKSIYGLKQASRSWNIGFDTAIKSYDFKRNVDEPCVYKRIINSIVAFLVLYVDDILLIGNDVGHLTEIKEWLATQFQMKDLGMQNIYKMKNSKKGLLPYRYGIHLSKEQCLKTPQEVEDMSNILYAFVVGSLMYAMLCTRPDICYSMEIVSRYQSNFGCDHWTAVKNILKYLRRIKDYMLVYGSKDLILTGYTDSHFQTDKDARKSTSGSVFTLNGGAVVWRSIKQSCIADSTMEAEYVAACEAAKEVV